MAWKFSKIVFFHGCFPSNIPKFAEKLFSCLRTAVSVINLYLHRYLRIFPIHFHLNHSKSHGCSHVYMITEIYYITLMLLLCFTCRIEKI